MIASYALNYNFPYSYLKTQSGSIMFERSGVNWNGYVSGSCPVQGCGIVDNHPWYFRARGDSWSMEIAEDQSIDCECLPLVGPYPGWLIEESWGKWPEAGYMEAAVAWELIEKVFEQFRNNELPYIAGEQTD
ncbi:hypothetical protein [Hahella chejuensis]|nr:hypothetical protein [Hahella chejuensis]